MDYDVEFISSLLNAESAEFKEAIKRIPSKYVQGYERKVYNFIKQYYVDTKGKRPSIKAVKNDCPQVRLVKPEDEISYYCDQLEKRVKYARLTTGNVAIQNALVGQDIKKAEEELQKLVTEVFEVSAVNNQTVRQGLNDRKAEYVKNRENEGIIGYQTGIAPFDAHIGGLQSEYIVLLGRYGLGKTFFLLMLGANLWPSLKKPLVVVSLEMTKKSIEGRLDSVIGGFSYSKYRKGLLSKAEEKKLVGLKTVYNSNPEILVIPGAGKHLTEIEYEILSIDPGLVLYDGLYLTDMGFKDTHKDTLHASRGLQRMCKKYDFPIIATSQIINEEEAKYARALQEDADIVLKQWRNLNMYNDDMMGFDLLKCREESSKLSWRMHWDFNSWNFSIYENIPDEDEEMQHE